MKSKQCWEFNSQVEMFSHLIGKDYGDNPEQEIDKIKSDKKVIADFFSDILALNSEQIGLDFGSGAGYIAQHIASKVKHLHCFDVSESFLDLARENCSEFNNTSFWQNSEYSLNFLKEESVDFCYSNNVFCHLNFYEFDLYFNELARVLKPNGLFLFDFLSTDSLSFDDDKYVFMKNLYKNTQGDGLQRLFNYNSLESALKLAEFHGFDAKVLEKQTGHPSTLLLLSKTQT